MLVSFLTCLVIFPVFIVVIFFCFSFRKRTRFVQDSKSRTIVQETNYKYAYSSLCHSGLTVLCVHTVKPLLGAPPIKQTLSTKRTRSRWCPQNRGFTVSCFFHYSMENYQLNKRFIFKNKMMTFNFIKMAERLLTKQNFEIVFLCVCTTYAVTMAVFPPQRCFTLWEVPGFA